MFFLYCHKGTCLSEVKGATQKANKCLSYLFYVKMGVHHI
jgi:hypothetical protein